MQKFAAWVLLFWVCVSIAVAQAPPADFVTDSIYDSPNGVTVMEFDHTGRLLYAEKQGRLMLLAPNGSGGFVTPPVVFANLVSQVVPTSESGLLGFALDPDYANTRYLYLFYTTASDQRLTRITANAGFTAMQAGSEVVLLSGLPRASFIHKAGDIHFAPGDPTSIYISVGDDGNASLAQNLSSYGGKMLRVDAATGQGLADNPFYDGNPDSVASRIFAQGLRNPFRFTFHPSNTGAAIAYSSENGDGTDRLSFIRGGSNGAWSPAGDGGGFLSPPDPNHRVLATMSPSVVGVALSPSGPFGTNVVYWGQWQGNIRRWQLSGGALDTATALDGGNNFKTGQATIDFQFGPDGHLYSCSAGNDAATGGFYPLRRLRYVGGVAPTAAFTTTPDPATGAAPFNVQFTDQSIAPGSSIASRLWQFGDGASASAPNPAHVYAQPGVYTARLTVSNTAGQQSSISRTVRATRSVQVSYQGTLRDGRALAGTALNTTSELRFYQADGVTPAAFPGGAGAGGNVLVVPIGGVNPLAVNLELTGDGVVLSAGEASGDGVHSARRGWLLPAGSGTHLLSGDFFLSSSMILGRITDTRAQPLIADLGLRRGNTSAAPAYAVAGGRDYLPTSGIAASGVAHRVVSDALGWYHFALRDADANSSFVVDAVADTGLLTHAAVSEVRTAVSGTALLLDIVSGIWSGGLDCDNLDAVAPTPNVDYAAQIQPIWSQNCIGCHTATATNSGGLDLDPAVSLAALLSVSAGAPGVQRVQAGQVLRSFLMEKINCANPQTGTRMRPATTMPLADQALIRDWIAQQPGSGPQLFQDGFE